MNISLKTEWRIKNLFIYEIYLQEIQRLDLRSHTFFLAKEIELKLKKTKQGNIETIN